jgi:hypothetical protein
MQPSLQRPSVLLKPTLDTPYHIDYSWFERSGEDLRREILSQLSQDQRDHISHDSEPRMVDYVDPDSGEVLVVDEIRMAIMTAARDPGFITEQISVIDGVFRVFLANNNQPLTPTELAERLGKPARTILGAISGRQIYKGIRPAL